jgi:hypothetical protein
MDKKFLKILIAAIAGVLIWFLFILLMTGCRVFKKESSSINRKDTVGISSQGSSKSDSSGSKTDKLYTKETYYLPGRDTVINNIIQPGHPQIIYVKESGREKTEQAQIIKDTSWKEAFNSLSVLIASKELDKKVKVGPSVIEWILIGAIALILLKQFNIINLPFKK